MGCVDEVVTKWMTHYVGEMQITQLVHGYRKEEILVPRVRLRHGRNATVVANAEEKQTGRGSSHRLAMHTFLLFSLIHLFLGEKKRSNVLIFIHSKKTVPLPCLAAKEWRRRRLTLPCPQGAKYLLPSFTTLAPLGQRPWVRAAMLPPENNDNNDFIELEAKTSSGHSGVLMHLSQEAKNRGTVLAAGWCTWCQGCSSSMARKSMPRCNSSLQAVLATTLSCLKDHWKIGF